MQDGGKKKQTQKAGVKPTPRKPSAPKSSTKSTISKQGVARESSHKKPTAPLVAFGSLTPYGRPATPLKSFGSEQLSEKQDLISLLKNLHVTPPKDMPTTMSMGGKKKKTKTQKK